MTDDDLKLLTNRAKLVLDYIMEERVRCTGLITAIDDRDFLLYCIHDACCQPSEIDHWRKRYDELQPIPLEEQMIDDASKRIPTEIDDLEDLM